MKRLPDQFDPRNADEAYIAGLLQNVHPFEPSTDQMQRVWTALERAPSRRPRIRMTGPVIAGLVLCGAAVASATMPQVWNRLQRASVEATPTPGTVVEKAGARRAPAAPLAPAVLSDPTSDTAALPPAPAPRPEAAARKSTSSKSHAELAPPDSPTSGMLMVEAMRERRAGNLARARDLAFEYRTQNPSGALYEEALALSFQAAAVLGDEDAKPLAKLYVQRYPGGRFRAQAQRVLDGAR